MGAGVGDSLRLAVMVTVGGIWSACSLVVASLRVPTELLDTFTSVILMSDVLVLYSVVLLV